jgi:hypothetical protein
VILVHLRMPAGEGPRNLLHVHDPILGSELAERALDVSGHAGMGQHQSDKERSCEKC